MAFLIQVNFVNVNMSYFFINFIESNLDFFNTSEF